MGNPAAISVANWTRDQRAFADSQRWLEKTLEKKVGCSWLLAANLTGPTSLESEPALDLSKIVEPALRSRPSEHATFTFDPPRIKRPDIQKPGIMTQSVRHRDAKNFVDRCNPC